MIVGGWRDSRHRPERRLEAGLEFALSQNGGEKARYGERKVFSRSQTGAPGRRAASVPHSGRILRLPGLNNR